MTKTTKHQQPKGFTIVELLIVIVVIAILATITIVAYNGIQQRAKNTATITAVKQAVNAINMYIAEHNAYPEDGTGSIYCLTTNQSCAWAGNPPLSSTELQTNLVSYSSLPSSVATTGNALYAGIVYQKNDLRKFNDINRPVVVVYALNGTNQQCQLPNVTDSGGAVMASSTSGFTTNNGGATICVISIEGPSV